MKKVLVVDNQPLMLKFISDLLEKEGHQVAVAENGLNALGILESFTPDIIFTDIIMPNINGEKLCRVIRTMPDLKDVFICVISGVAIEEDINFQKFGADSCIAKGPLDRMSTHLLTVVEQSENRETSPLSGKILGLEDLLQREMTEELLSSKKHTEIILNNLAEGILELTRDGKIIFVNPAAESVIGSKEEMLLGTDFLDIFADDHRARVADIMSCMHDTAQTIPDNRPVILNEKQVALQILPAVETKNRSIIVIINNIDERKRLEYQLQQARKMEAIGTLAGGIAHEFNNALVGVTGNIELLKMDLTSDINFDEYLNPMMVSVRRMSQLTKRLLAYARGGKYRSGMVKLHQFVEETLPVVTNKIRKDIRIETDIPTSVYAVEADHTQLQMVLAALIDNAVEAIKDKGRIRIIVKQCEVDVAFAHQRPGLKPGKYACLIVEDDGTGMDESVKEKVFEPFFTTNFQGRGLGLSATYGIVKNHNGWISVESHVGKGTIVSIYLPCAGPKEIENS